MSPYEQLYTISWSMLRMFEQQDWDTFYEAEKERQALIDHIQENVGNYIATDDLLKRLIDIHHRLESKLQEQQHLAKHSLTTLQKGKKANQHYQSNQF